MPIMRRHPSAAVVVLAAALATTPALAAAASGPALPPTAAAHDVEALALFNGKDLDGWRHVLVDETVPASSVWTVRDGVLVCTGTPLGYLYTDAEYTSFRLVVEWRWAPGAAARLGDVPNNGVLMRVTPARQGIPPSYEAQLKSGDAGDVYAFWGRELDGDPARRREGKARPLVGDMIGFKKLAAAERPEGEWNRMEVTFDGPTMTVVVNGQKVNEVTGAEVRAGRIALQSEGGEIHFRKVDLLPLGR